MDKEKVPIADKALLTVDEAAEYFNIGKNKIRELTELQEYLESNYSV